MNTLKIKSSIDNWAKHLKFSKTLKIEQNIEKWSKHWKFSIILKNEQITENETKHWKWNKTLKNCQNIIFFCKTVKMICFKRWKLLKNETSKVQQQLQLRISMRNFITYLTPLSTPTPPSVSKTLLVRTEQSELTFSICFHIVTSHSDGLITILSYPCSPFPFRFNLMCHSLCKEEQRKAGKS